MTAPAPDQIVQNESGLSDVLLEQNLLDEKSLDYARKVQGRMDKPRPLGEVLVGLKLLSRSQLQDTLRLYKQKIKIGDLLVESGLISRDQLGQALEVQKSSPDRRLGELLVDLGFIAEPALLKAISEQKDIPYIEPDTTMLDRQLLGRISMSYLINHRVIPFSIEDNHLRVIVPDLPNPEVVRELENLFGRPLRFALGPREKIVAVLKEYQELQGGPGSFAGKTGEQEKVSDLVNFLIAEAIRLDASDIHLEPLANRMRVRYRVDGMLIHRTDFPKEMEKRIVARIKILAKADITEQRHHQDGRFQLELDGQEIDLRLSTYVTIHGENVVLRLLNKRIGLMAVEDLGMSPVLLEKYIDFVLRAPAGVVVITGPTGSGKTTTLYSSIDFCNNIGVKIITAEDPVEYQIEGIMQCSINPKIGLTFEDTLKAIVRQDPDIIVLGEIRDRISAETAIQAALTGHKVFTTFHTEDSVGGLLRLMNMEIESFLISSTVICVVAQRLVRKICPHCREETEPDPKELFLLDLEARDLRGFKFFKGRGCANCNHTGYRGRSAIFELLVLDEQVKDAILVRKTSYHIRQISIMSSGLITLLEAGLVKVAQGMTTFEEIMSRAPKSIKPRPLREILQRVGEKL